MSRLAFRFQSDIDRFMAKVIVREDGCWEWKASKFHNGYGQFEMAGPQRAHRVSYWNFVGEFDEDLQILHSCDNPWCVAPKHLNPGTNQENRSDSYNKGRGNIGERNGAVSLNEPVVLEIRSLFESGFYTKAELSRKFKTGQSNIQAILERRTWRHV